MKRIVMVLLICMVSLAGCSKAASEIARALSNRSSESQDEDYEAIKLDDDTTFYNDYLGVSYTIPKGWWLYDLSEDNFSEDKGDVSDPILMDIVFNDYSDYNDSLIWLINFGNLESSTRNNHLGFTLEARSLDGTSGITNFKRYFEDYMLEPTENEEYTLIESEQANINGKVFELTDYLVTREKDDFNIVTLICEVKNGYFFIVMVDYWPENTKAKENIIESVGKAIGFY